MQNLGKGLGCPQPGSYSCRVGGLKPGPHCCFLLKVPPFQGFSFLEATQRAAQHKGMMELAGMTRLENRGKLLEDLTLQGQRWGQPGWGTVTKKGTWTGMELRVSHAQGIPALNSNKPGCLCFCRAGGRQQTCPRAGHYPLCRGTGCRATMGHMPKRDSSVCLQAVFPASSHPSAMLTLAAGSRWFQKGAPLASVLRQAVGTGWHGRALFFLAGGDRLSSSEQESATTSPAGSSFLLAGQLLPLTRLLPQGVFSRELRLPGSGLSTACGVGGSLHPLAATGHSSPPLALLQ